MRLTAMLIAAGLLAATLPAMAAQDNLAAAIKSKKSTILDYLTSLPAQKKTLAGVQVNEYEVYIDCSSADRLKEISGKRPALLGLELMNAIAYPPYPAYLVDRAVAQSAAGGIVTMSWHARNPVEVCLRGEYFDCTQKTMSAETLKAVLTAGTREHALWAGDVHAMAKTLHTLRDKGVVVLFRPYHEMNGGWFWWGKQDAMPQLWDALYEELTRKEQLDNLIWVFSVDREAPDAARYFPQKHKPDLVGTDMYEPDAGSWKFAAAKTALGKLAGPAPFVFSEVGLAPTQKVLDDLNPAYVLLWGDMLNGAWAKDGTCQYCNKPEAVAAFVTMPRVVTLETLPPALKAAVSAGVDNPAPLHKSDPVCPAQLH